MLRLQFQLSTHQEMLIISLHKPIMLAFRICREAKDELSFNINALSKFAERGKMASFRKFFAISHSSKKLLGCKKYTLLNNCGQEVASSGSVLTPGLAVISSAPSPHIYSLATSGSMVSNTPGPTKDAEPARRRFTEEKDDKIPESLLGYQVT